jgi:C4-type Zn-finger protein
MLPDRTRDFTCPTCSAVYRLVRVQAAPETVDRMLHCPVCRQPLTSREGDYVLKYFLVSPRDAHRPHAPRTP